MSYPVKVIDLFAGIGGFHTAFHNIGAEVVFASEWDKAARETYTANYESVSPNLFVNENLFAGDITQVDAGSIPDFDVLCAGFPCQPFSNAGKRGGFEDTRGTLFFDVCRIIDAKRPKAFFLENVRGLLSHDDGKTFTVIREALDKLGYDLSYKIVKASDYNVPQHRPRLFMVGFRKDLKVDFVWPEPVKLTNTISEVLGGKVTTPAGNEREIGFTLRVGGRRSGVNDRRNWDTYIVDGAVRTITTAEGLAIQGFPPTFKFPVSEAQAFKQLGNSVAVPAVQAVASNIVAALNSQP